MNVRIQNLRNEVERQRGRRDQIQKGIDDTQRTLRHKRRALEQHEQAREVIRTVGQMTQEQLQYHISEIASLALSSVFPNPYSLVVKFVPRRNKTECDILFERNGSLVDPLAASGGGAVDVAAFALRAASWSMSRPRSRATLILDEPFKHLKGIGENRRVLDMVKEISSEMGVQIIMVSDERVPREDIVERADRVFEVNIRNGVSQVLEMK